jgi:hypothetical protein
MGLKRRHFHILIYWWGVGMGNHRQRKFLLWLIIDQQLSAGTLVFEYLTQVVLVLLAAALLWSLLQTILP